MFAPRIKDLKERKLHTIEKPSAYPLLEPLIGEPVDPALIITQWPELMPLKASIEVFSPHSQPHVALLPARWEHHRTHWRLRLVH